MHYGFPSLERRGLNQETDRTKYANLWPFHLGFIQHENWWAACWYGTYYGSDMVKDNPELSPSLNCRDSSCREPVDSLIIQHTLSTQLSVWLWMNWQMFPQEVVLNRMNSGNIIVGSPEVISASPDSDREPEGSFLCSRWLPDQRGLLALRCTVLHSDDLQLHRRGQLLAAVLWHTSPGPFWNVLLPISSSSRRVW